MLRSLSLRIARPVLMNGLPPPSDPGDATAPAEPGMKPPECITASHPSLPHHPDKCPTNDQRPRNTENQKPNDETAQSVIPSSFEICHSSFLGHSSWWGIHRSLLVEARAFLLHDRRADLIAGELHAEAHVARRGPADPHPIDHLALDRERRNRIEHQRLTLS